MTLSFFIVGNLLVFIPPTSPQPTASSTPDEKSSSDSELDPSQSRSIRSELPYILLVIWGFVASLGMYFPAFYIQLFARTHGLEANLSFYSLAIMNAASVFGRVLPNWAADRWGKLEVFLPCATIGGMLIELSLDMVRVKLMCFWLRAIGLVGFAMLGSTTPAGLVIFVILCVSFFLDFLWRLLTTLFQDMAFSSELAWPCTYQVSIFSLLLPFAVRTGASST